MRTGLALIIHRFAPFPLGTTTDTVGKIYSPFIRRPILALVAGIFFTAVVASQAQESIEPDVLPALPQSLPSTAAEPVPSAAEPLPSSEQAFPSSPQPLSPSMNYSGGYTTVVPAPVAAGPYGRGGTYNVFPTGETISPSGRIFHYELRLTVRGVWDDNIFITHTNKVSDYYFAIEPEITIGVGDIEGRNRGYLRLDYMPSAILFVDHSDEDAFNQLIHLEGGYSWTKLTLSLTES